MDAVGRGSGEGRLPSQATFRIIYSVFWGTKADLVIIDTFGAPEEKWPSVAPIAEAMARVELIGPNYRIQQ